MGALTKLLATYFPKEILIEVAKTVTKVLLLKGAEEAARYLEKKYKIKIPVAVLDSIRQQL